MKRKNFLTFMISVLMIAIGAIYFIRRSNNHLECEKIKSVKVLDNGAKVEKIEHICKEKYNL